MSGDHTFSAGADGSFVYAYERDESACVKVRRCCRYGQVCAQIFPHPRAFDGMLARAPGSQPMSDSDLYVSLQHLNETLHLIYTRSMYTIAIRSPERKLKTSLKNHVTLQPIIPLIRKRDLDE